MFYPKSLSVIIIKPTKVCNANCTHCSSPPDSNIKISVEDFKLFCEKNKEYIRDNVNIIWHGGEPTLMGVDYYYKVWDIAKSYFPNVRFSMQTNLLIYNEEIDKLFTEVFENQISTSFDFFTNLRQINNDQEKYKKIFFKNLENRKKSLIKQSQGNFIKKTFLVNVVDRNNLKKYKEIYEIAKEKMFDLRVNYIYSVGRALKDETFQNNFNPKIHITPDEYGDFLINIAKLYFKDILENFNNKDLIRVVPIYDLLRNYLNGSGGNQVCPWINNCNGHFLGIEPNGDIYNCADFADVDGFKFGNFKINTAKEMFFSDNSKKLSTRRFNLPEDCRKCEYLDACQGGCMRDSYIYNGDSNGKFFFCNSWKKTFKYFDSLDKKTLIFIEDRIKNYYGMSY